LYCINVLYPFELMNIVYFFANIHTHHIRKWKLKSPWLYLSRWWEYDKLVSWFKPELSYYCLLLRGEILVNILLHIKIKWIPKVIASNYQFWPYLLRFTFSFLTEKFTKAFQLIFFKGFQLILAHWQKINTLIEWLI